MTASILSLMTRVFGHAFAGASWDGWKVILRVLTGLPIESAADAELLQRWTGRTSVEAFARREAWILAGRRAGKSRIAALVAVYATCCRTYTLAAGEVGVFMVIAADRKQARVVKRYISGLLHISPVLAQLIARETRDAIVLTSGLIIEIHTASYRALRGYTVIGCVADEVCFWQDDDSANPDAEILTALRAAMVTVPEALLLCISSPYARRGEAWRIFRQHFAKDDAPVLVVKAPTRDLNPTVPADEVDRAYADDAVRAATEFGAEFRSDVESFITPEALDLAIVRRLNLPAAAAVTYRAFVDPAGSGSVNADSLTAAVGHRDAENRLIIDALFEKRPPFSPEATVAELAEWLKPYRVREVTGDRYAGEWPREQFRKHGISYRTAEHPKSHLYREFLPLLNSGRVELPDWPRLRAQFAGLERRVARGGRESIDHTPGAHDDLANAVAGVAVQLAARRRAPHDYGVTIALLLSVASAWMLRAAL